MCIHGNTYMMHVHLESSNKIFDQYRYFYLFQKKKKKNLFKYLAFHYIQLYVKLYILLYSMHLLKTKKRVGWKEN